MKTIGKILARYTAWLGGLLAPFGVWGALVLALADSALLGLPIDAIIAAYVYKDRGHFLLYVLLASLGSAVGSIPLYLLGYLGGEKVLRRRISEERFQKIHYSFERHEFWALMFPAMLPPPTPFKVFILGAAVFEMRFSHFLIAIFSGRFARFLLVSLLALWFGPTIVALAGGLFRRHFYWVLGALAGGLLLWLWVRRRTRRAKPGDI